MTFCVSTPALGRCLIALDRPIDAEALLRQSVAVQAEKQPNHWRRFEAMSLLGAAVGWQRRFAEAESLLIAGYEGIHRHPLAPEIRKSQARERIVRCYRAWGRADAADHWMARR
jgi:predicted ATPase